MKEKNVGVVKNKQNEKIKKQLQLMFETFLISPDVQNADDINYLITKYCISNKIREK